MEIRAETVASFLGGRRELMRATEPGIYELVGKGAPARVIRVAYPAGAVLVVHSGRIIAGPVAAIDAMELAHVILAGDAQALTAPDSLLTLAAAVFGFGLAAQEPAKC